MKILLILVLFFSFSSSLKAEEIDAKKTYIKTLTEYLELRIKNDNSGLKNLPLTQEKVLDRQPVLISFTIDGKGFLLDSFFEKKSKQEIINDRIDRLITFLFLIVKKKNIDCSVGLISIIFSLFYLKNKKSF